jgi:hypothetical protein
VLGVVFPGMGHYYSGRSLGGTLVLAAAGAAVATGVLFKTVTVRCLNPSVGGGDCPPGDVVGEETSRPYLVPALGAAAAVTVVAAVEAFVRARGRRAAAAGAGGVTVAARAPEGPRVTGPSLTARRGRVELNLVGVRFR